MSQNRGAIVTYRGHIKNGVIVIDEPVELPEGAEVRVEVSAPSTTPDDNGETLGQMLLRHAGVAEGLPSDLARNHDHYIHGTPKE